MKTSKKHPQPKPETAPPAGSVQDVLSRLSDLNLEEGQKGMIAGALKLGQTSVKEIMVPRNEMVCADQNSTVEEIRKRVLEGGHSRLPLYDGEIDKITGILHLRDLFVALKADQPVDLRKIARKPFFVPDGKKLDDLLAEMRKQKTQVAMVVDEYGGIAGLVTIEDIIEEIVGEIQDEYLPEVPDIQRIDEHSIIVKARVGLKEINEVLGTNLPEEKFESVGGLIYDLVGGVPELGKIVKHKGLQFKVEKVRGQQIKAVRVSKKA